MDLVTLAVVAIAAAVVALVAVLVPAIGQLRNTLASADKLIRDLDATVKPLLEDDIRPMVQSVTRTLDEVEGVVRKVGDGVGMVDDTIASVHEVSDTIRAINDIANTRIKTAVIDIS
ncbi:MAG TPA: DUF948 domain-containing protein, partial [Nitrospirota bacterium]